MDFALDIPAYSFWQPTADAPKPDVSFVPPLDRRRLTALERAALHAAWRVRPSGEVPVVFASRWGEIGVTLKLMRQFHADGEMSPAGFSASVHNAAPGAFSLLAHSRAPYTALAAGARSLESGLLEALALRREVLFVFAEEATPEFYRPAFEDVQEACALAVRLVPSASGACACTVRPATRAPARLDAFVSFLEGRADRFETASCVLLAAARREVGLG